MDQEKLSLLACPKCKSSINISNSRLVCVSSKCESTYPIVQGIPCFLEEELDFDTDLSVDKWQQFYIDKEKKLDYEQQYKIYLEDNFNNVYNQLSEYADFDTKPIFLEIGCGPMVLGRALHEKCKLIVGVDFSFEALKMAETMLKSSGVTNYLLILADIKNMPIKDNKVDVLYGGGVIEHFKDTLSAVNEGYRVLKDGGVSFNTVPHLNIGSLTYRQVWGNIPNFPVLKQIAEFVHIKILKSKHMVFGYEYSFLGTHVKYLHKKVGFNKVIVKKFDTKLMFEFIPLKALKTFFIWLADNCVLFWPMIKVIGIK